MQAKRRQKGTHKHENRLQPYLKILQAFILLLHPARTDTPNATAMDHGAITCLENTGRGKETAMFNGNHLNYKKEKKNECDILHLCFALNALKRNNFSCNNIGGGVECNFSSAAEFLHNDHLFNTHTHNLLFF